MRPHGAGSLFAVGDRWVFQRSLFENGRRVRRSVSGATQEEALSKAARRTDWGTRQTIAERRAAAKRARVAALHADDHTTGRERNGRAVEYVERVVRIARIEGWSADHVARVIVATLTPSRVRRGIFGPCAYCKSWLASAIDHVVPTVRGGSDEPSNLVSACKSCNSQKADRTPAEWGWRPNMASQVASRRERGERR